MPRKLVPPTVVFPKTGKEIKVAVENRRHQLQARLDKRNQTLSDFVKDPVKVRSYMIRNTQSGPLFHTSGQGYALYSIDEISSEELEEISQLCERIAEIEAELYRLALLTSHLPDDQVFELSFDDLIGFGFEVSTKAKL